MEGIIAWNIFLLVCFNRTLSIYVLNIFTRPESPDHGYITRRDILSRFYTSSFFSSMVKFGRSVFELLVRMVKNWAIRFSIYSAVWILLYGQVWFYGIAPDL